MHLPRILLFSFGALWLGGCSLVVDGKLDGKEAASPCTGADDGTSCELGEDMMSGPGVCRSQVCTLSTCGDGLTDSVSGEECDDGNETSGDGCEPGTCELTCEEDADCEDAFVCNGTETCDGATNTCSPGSNAPDETSCELDDGTEGACRSGTCRTLGCGNGLPDEGEECDDGNDVSDDGCEPDCTITCMNDDDCIPLDTSVCDGTDTCDTGTNTCVPGTSLDCDDGNDCTADSCDPVDGCINDPLPFDMDEDGHPVESCGGDDCDDSDPDIYEGAEELCDDKDNNCDGNVDEVAPFWYIDCDGDGFAADTSGTQQQCDEPAPAGSCGWTTTRPIGPDTTDCRDDNALVFPGQTMNQSTPISGEPSATDFDYNCDGNETPNYPIRPTFIIACGAFSGCTGSTYWDETGPRCGLTSTLSYCVFNRFTGCGRATREEVMRCR